MVKALAQWIGLVFALPILIFLWAAGFALYVVGDRANAKHEKKCRKRR